MLPTSRMLGIKRMISWVLAQAITLGLLLLFHLLVVSAENNPEKFNSLTY